MRYVRKFLRPTCEKMFAGAECHRCSWRRLESHQHTTGFNLNEGSRRPPLRLAYDSATVRGWHTRKPVGSDAQWRTVGRTIEAFLLVLVARYIDKEIVVIRKCLLTTSRSPEPGAVTGEGKMILTERDSEPI